MGGWVPGGSGDCGGTPPPPPPELDGDATLGQSAHPPPPIGESGNPYLTAASPPPPAYGGTSCHGTIAFGPWCERQLVQYLFWCTVGCMAHPVCGTCPFLTCAVCSFPPWQTQKNLPASSPPCESRVHVRAVGVRLLFAPLLFAPPPPLAAPFCTLLHF